jgi:DNA modification methylase
MSDVQVFCAFDEKVPIEKVTGNPRNPNKHPERQIELLAKIIAAQGWRAPITVSNRSGFVVRGHGRLAAAQRLGLTWVPVDKQDYESEAAEWADMIADNRIAELAEPDLPMLADILLELDTGAFDMDLTGFEELDLTALMAGTGGSDLSSVKEDEVPDPPEVPITQLGDLWMLGEHRLLCGDATLKADVARLLDGATVDCCLTDPPYCSGGFQESGRGAGSVGTDAAHKQVANDRLSTRGYQAILAQAFSNTQAPYLYAFTDWRMWSWLFDVAESLGYGVRSMIAWDKGTPGMGRGWRAQHELILWACKKTPPFDKKFAGKGNVIAAQRTGNPLHTTQKPVSLIAELMENTPFAKTVIDPFCGSGTTLVAAGQLGRRFYGLELDPAYVDVAVTRWENLTGRKAERV